MLNNQSMCMLRVVAMRLIAVFLAAQVGLAAAATGEVVVEISDVTASTGGSVLRLPGTVISTRDAAISSELTGRLTWVAEVGQQIAKSEPLAIIDDHLLQLQLRDDWAGIERSKADIEYNQRQIKRLEKLALQNNTAKSELDQMQSRLQMLVQDQRVAEVRRERTLYDLQRSRIGAPFDGIVVSRAMSAGEITESGSPLLRLVDTRALEISVNAPLRVASYVQSGSQVQVENEGLKLLASVRGVIPVGDARSRMMELRLILEPGHWLIGQAVTVELPDGESSVGLSVPRDSLVLRDGEVYVFTVSEDNLAVKVPVVPGAGSGSRIAIDGDLQLGDAVVVRGAERLREGQLVKVTGHHVAESQ
ncbi:MAG: efflux RND transporter periplasmic adaptor subunit [Halioglobus sp.]